jgi:hypothetical protein
MEKITVKNKELQAFLDKKYEEGNNKIRKYQRNDGCYNLEVNGTSFILDKDENPINIFYDNPWGYYYFDTLEEYIIGKESRFVSHASKGWTRY